MSAEQINRQAADWLARLDRGGSAETRAAFDRWKAADPRHVVAYARLTNAWERLDRLSALRAPDVELPIGQAPELPSTRHRTVRRAWSAGIAAGLALLAVGVGTYAWWSTTRVHTYATSVGGYTRVPLQDGSTLELNTDTRVRVSLSASRRRVQLLRGEASFEVAHDPQRPFIVIAGQTAIRAVGTQFNVRRLRELEIVVTEGRIAVETDGAAGSGGAAPADVRMVNAGEAAAVDRFGIHVRGLSSDETDRLTAWRAGLIISHDRTLAEIVDEYNRYSRRHVVVPDPDLARLRLGGYFRTDNLSGFIATLEDSFGIESVPRGEQIILRRRDDSGISSPH